MSNVVNLTPFGGVVLESTAAPLVGDGLIGNIWLRKTTGIADLYGPKSGSGWGTPVSLIGPPNSLSIGTVTTGTASATITGTAPSQTLNLTIPQGPAGGLTARTTATATTTSLAPGAVWQGTVSLPKAFYLLSVGTDAAAWVRVYPRAVDRTNDLASLRGITDDPPDGRVTAEVATGGVQVIFPDRSASAGANLDSPAAATQYLAVQNLGSTTVAIEVEFTYLLLE